MLQPAQRHLGQNVLMAVSESGSRIFKSQPYRLLATIFLSTEYCISLQRFRALETGLSSLLPPNIDMQPGLLRMH
jgi:hypothetical protein